MYSIENRDFFEHLNKVVSLHNQVEELKLQDRFGKQKFHENVRKVYEPLTDKIKNFSGDITKTMTETSIKNKKNIREFKRKGFRIDEW